MLLSRRLKLELDAAHETTTVSTGASHALALASADEEDPAGDLLGGPFCGSGSPTRPLFPLPSCQLQTVNYTLEMEEDDCLAAEGGAHLNAKPLSRRLGPYRSRFHPSQLQHSLEHSLLASDISEEGFE